MHPLVAVWRIKVGEGAWGMGGIMGWRGIFRAIWFRVETWFHKLDREATNPAKSL